MTDQPEKTCKDCRHWHRIEGLIDGRVIEEDKKPGECRGGPPSPVPLIGVDGMGRPTTLIQSRYPQHRPEFPICRVFEERKKQ